MSSGKREDPKLLLLVACAAAGALVLRMVSELDLRGVWSLLLSMPEVPTAMATALGGVAVVRSVVTRRALRSRVTFAVVPADEFDPSIETVVRFAAQLARVRRTVRGWADFGASAIRVRLENDREGRLAYLLEVPARSQQLVRAALRTYEGVELRDPHAILNAGSTPTRHRVRAELVLAEPSVEPLARLALDPDPLAAFAAALRPLRPAAGERATCEPGGLVERCRHVDVPDHAEWQLHHDAGIHVWAAVAGRNRSDIRANDDTANAGCDRRDWNAGTAAFA